MRARNGQVALYLFAVLVAICVLTMMNVGTYLAVSARNKATNAGDAAAIAVAKYQGELINRIGALNLEHVRTIIDPNISEAERLSRCDEIMAEQKRICFLDPLEGIGIGSNAARDNGVDEEPTGGMKRILEDHVNDIRTVYIGDPELYPEPWDGAWEEYAQRLQMQLAADVLAGPENPEFADAWRCDPLVNQQFYQAVAGRQWCWFKFNGTWMFDCDSGNMPRPQFEEPTPRWNSEIYPLHLTFRSLGGVDRDLARMLARLADCNENDIVTNRLFASEDQHWAFYDGRWSRWSTSESSWIDAFNPNVFPIIGSVKPEYDVRGCAAKCRVITTTPDLVRENDGGHTVVFTSAAKPFGTVGNADGGQEVVTANRNFVTPAFTDVRLVPTDSVGGRDLDGGADFGWVEHVRKHLPEYLAHGPTSLNGCWYCQQLVHWEKPSFRRQGVNWLRFHSDECVITGGDGSYQGGTVHAH